MARRLVAAGHEVTMITSLRDGPTSGGWSVTNEAGIAVHWLPLPYSNRLSYAERIRAFFRFAALAAGHAAQIPADVVFATSTPLTIALPAVYASKRQNAPMVFEVRDLWPEVPIALGAIHGSAQIGAAQRLEAFAYNNAAAIVALSPDMKRGIVQSGYPPAQVTVIPNGCDLGLFHVEDEKAQALRSQFEWMMRDRPIVLYAGALGRVNGIGYLADIAADMMQINPEVCFVIIGDGIESAHVERRARMLGVYEKNFFMLPTVPKREIPQFFALAAVTLSFVIDVPELWANSANKVFDGFAAGKCVAINHRGWQADLLVESGAGFILPPADAPVAAALLAQVLNSPGYLKQAGEAALDLARTQFDRDVLAGQLEQVLMQAVQSNKVH